MKNKYCSFLLFTAFACVVAGFTEAKANIVSADSTPVKGSNKDAKAIVSDYITAIGGMDAVKKLNSTDATGTLSVQGMALEVKQKRLAPNKTMQSVIMNGNPVGKTVFNGTKGYQEQMGNHIDMTDEDIADMKTQTALIPQADYITNPAYKLSVQGTDKVNNADAYKVLVTMPSGKADTEFYDVATKLLVKQVIERSMQGQSAVVTYQFDDYKKAGDVLLPYKLSLVMAAGAMNQSIDILLTDIKVNEGVTAADFE